MRLRPGEPWGGGCLKGRNLKALPCQGMGKWAWTLSSSAMSYQGSQESAKLVFSETEILEEEEEPKEAEAEAEAGSQTDMPAAAVQCCIALQPACPFSLRLQMVGQRAGQGGAAGVGGGGGGGGGASRLTYCGLKVRS